MLKDAYIDINFMMKHLPHTLRVLAKLILDEVKQRLHRKSRFRS